MKERGFILPDSNPQPEIQKHSETADWEYREYSQFLYGVGSEMMWRFFNGLEYEGKIKVPNPLFAFDETNYRTLGFYDLRPDEYGLMFKITINTAHFEDIDGKKEYKFGKWVLCEVALHELIHVWQQHGGGKDPYVSGRNTHNREFVDKAESFGLHPAPVAGWHKQVADADKPFGVLMRHFGIPRPDDVPRITTKGHYFQDKERKGRSTLTKWACECGQSVNVGKKDWPGAVCNACGTQYIRAERGTIYKSDSS